MRKNYFNKCNSIIQLLQMITLLFISYSCSTTTNLKQLPNVDANEKELIVEKISDVLLDEYVSLETAKECGRFIKEKLSNGGYDNFQDPQTFADEIANDLQRITNDKHIRLSVLTESDESNEESSGPKDYFIKKVKDNQDLKRGNYGFMCAEWNAGNIGYLDLRAFISVDIAREKAISVMKFLSDMDAIIIDLRKEVRGGAPEMVSLICSYFFEKPTLLNTIYYRKADVITENWTLAKVDGKKMADVPLFILTGKNVFSAGEAFAYSLQALKRATLIGGVTMGGANITRPVQLNERFVFYLPFGKAINPITGTNWEGKGITPDILVDEDDALEVALELAKHEAEEHRKIREQKNIKLASDIYGRFVNSVQQFAEGKTQEALSSLRNIISEGYNMGVLTEEMINDVGYDLLNKKMTEVAIELFKLNVDQFPYSYNVYDSLGEAYMIAGENNLAIKNYQKSLELNPHNESAKKYIEKLK